MQADLNNSIPGVEDIHHVHAWSLTQERPMVTLHARIADPAQAMTVSAAVKDRLRARFGVAHATVEIECEGCADDAPHRPTHERSRA
jgi:cobalt-zinc-cadmium efflux system protein